jgi:hypothetical protein
MPDITPTAFQDEIMNGFGTFWAARSQIASPNRVFDREKVPAGDDAFIEWTITGDGGSDGQTRYSHSVERNHFSRVGRIVFTASTRLHTGVDPAYALLDAVGHFLEAYKLANAIFTEIGSPLDLGHDGAWHQVSLTANWLYFTDRPSTVT